MFHLGGSIQNDGSGHGGEGGGGWRLGGHVTLAKSFNSYMISLQAMVKILRLGSFYSITLTFDPCQSGPFELT
jgi:hypothetical protein